MKRVVACLVLAVAVAGCGSDESGWQDEWRAAERQHLSDMDPVRILQEVCLPLDESGEADGRDIMKQEILDEFSKNDTFRQNFEDLLDDFGAVADPKAFDEASEIIVDELIRACP